MFAVAELHCSNFSRIADTVRLKVADEAARTLAQRFAARVDFSEQFARVEPSEFVCVMTACR